jgi:hypothetical protein
MAKVFGAHEIHLKPGANTADFERFVAEEVLPAFRLPGVTTSLMKGDRGARDGQYLMVSVFEDVQTRDHHYPVHETPSDAALQLDQAFAATLQQRWAAFAEPLISQDESYTDYVVVSEQPS